MAADPFAGLEPARLWQLFAELSKTPRPSKKEETVLAWVDAWAASRKLEIRHDATGNRVVVVPATAGREKAPVVILQAHVDMVCEKHSWSTFDPEAGRIRIEREGEWLVAPETTLGADNGIGVVLMMFVAESGLPHGPLELLFTVDEETGLTGAAGLDTSLITGRTLLNLDSEEDGFLYIGCAGGTDTALHWSGRHSSLPPGWVGQEIRVSGLLGGHSGGEIHKNRANSLKAMARTLREIATRTPFRLARLSGGNKRNAIPREATATIALPAGAEAKVGEAVAASLGALRERFGRREPDLAVVSVPAGAPAAAYDEAATKTFVGLLSALPNGVIAMSQEIEGLVETSTNLAVATMGSEGGAPSIVINQSSRSSDAEEMEEVVDQIASAATLAGCRIESFDKYGGWKPAPSSRVVQLADQVHRELFGAPASVTAIHAGLECGLFAEKLPGLDMVSFGPDIRGPHAPGEKVSIPSTQKFVKWLGGVLEALSR